MTRTGPCCHPLLRALVIAFCAAASLLSVGLAADDTKTEPIQLKLWHGFANAEIDMLRKNVDAFQKEESAKLGRPVILDVQYVSFADMVSRTRASAQARMLPDLIFMDANSMVQIVYGGVAMPLDSLPGFPAGGIDALAKEYVAGAFETNVVTFKGKRQLYGLPVQTTTLALFWNKNMFRARAKELRAAGLDPDRAPRDWDEFVKYGKILTYDAVVGGAKKRVYGFGMSNSFWFSMPYFNQYGADIVARDADGKLVPRIASPRGVAAAERRTNFYLIDKIEGGAWTDSGTNPDTGFANQQYAMVLNGPWLIDKFRKTEGLDFSVALIPEVPQAEARALGLITDTTTRPLTAGNVGGQNIVVTNACQNPSVALAFARFFSSAPVQRGWAEELGQIPTNLAAQENLKLEKFPEVRVFMEQTRTARALPPLPRGGMIETDIINPEMNLVLQGRQTVPQALTRIEQILKAKVLDDVNAAEADAAEEAKVTAAPVP